METLILLLLLMLLALPVSTTSLKAIIILLLPPLVYRSRGGTLTQKHWSFLQQPNRMPLHKCKLSESAKRRSIRRPFTVAEVEALVQAVEELGTGRWRDVKLRAFDNAKHRTCVDLKDKWKTLVHKARISPQQRRGEPVPQELLDRVLKEHAYWSLQQDKHQMKALPDTCLLL